MIAAMQRSSAPTRRRPSTESPRGVTVAAPGTSRPPWVPLGTPKRIPHAYRLGLGGYRWLSRSGSARPAPRFGRHLARRAGANASLTDCLGFALLMGTLTRQHHACGGGHRHGRADRARRRCDGLRPRRLDRLPGWLKPRIDKRHKPLYDGLWRRKVSPENKRWARRVAACESGMTRRARRRRDLPRRLPVRRGHLEDGPAVPRWRSDRLQLQDPGLRRRPAQGPRRRRPLAELPVAPSLGED